MENKLLNEEKYQNTKKRITRLSLIILIVSIAIGGGLIIFSITKENSSADAVKIETLERQYEDKMSECDSLDMKDADWYSKVNKCHREASTIKSEINSLHTSKHGYTFLTVLGIFVIIGGGFISLGFYIFSKQREILAFQVQQVMPVAKEGLADIAPTIGKAGASVAKEMAPVYGDVAKEISKGIKEGLKDDNKE